MFCWPCISVKFLYMTNLMHSSLPSFMFIPKLYMFQALMCSSSGELMVSIWHLVYVTLCRWPECRFGFHPNLHTRQSST
jgi:hypothetical protein